ncbi:HAD-superfamily hydrolase, subfamily IA, variant 1 [Natrinema pellirubrum DSM 15624]|uniref:HAD-superfamily hydrolase, subfamily IA, variant 1 n=1 Tax=Natrinema pellirubrum (strain DSM 15624 / CIP 106293 / JCM 10476 / NCIMB 786 / 157) TaxID=797303 RepID=L0JMF0_NATP1|nr:HAD-IA family hydrolase [Natrinema pellirubrum]AGB31546.1 haloacid dehalogenase superfamily enzyme, subfamily IA [Natrinema pellirubrum DSM 15624]ELY73336.1 HAD-superfamily hydrolase, subfamily IA, variant 1 [Natrinema pellirubrum DSM 15624]
MSEYDAIVYDLDGTLVDLVVDWDAVATDVRAVYDDANLDPPGEGLWAMLEGAAEVGLHAEVEAAIAAHEHEGARSSERLAHADELLERSLPAGVCSLNCERACRIALEEHALSAAVEAVVGRDTVGTWKPDPEPLLATARRLEVEPGRALFVGDSERDLRTAERAGMDFEYVGERPSGV